MRHPISDANETSPFGELSPDDFYARHSVTHSSEFITNARGMKLFTQHWLPKEENIVGCVAVVHGFTGETSWFVQLTAVHIAKQGFATCAIDHQGHGFSDGLYGLTSHIPDVNPVVNPVVDDCITYFKSFREKHAPGLPAFLYSESLGSAIALLITLRPESPPWDGAILHGAMCGISQKFKPPWPLEHLLSLASFLIPTWRVVPTRGSIPDMSFKVEWKRRLAMASPRRRVDKPRAATAQELLRICSELQRRFEEIKVPLLIVHGQDDKVCDVACVEELYKRAGSTDKTLKIYPGMWHQLIGEPEENVEIVFGDVINWLKKRAAGIGGGA